MDSITLENFRCFRERQTARLAPLTLLVGENSTGKTSFLALIRALATFAYGERQPDFKEPPYDLGSFDEIAHYRGGQSGRARTFTAGFTARRVRRQRSRRSATPYAFEVSFAKRATVPVPVRRRIASGDTWIEDALGTEEGYAVRFGTSRGSWSLKLPTESRAPLDLGENIYLFHAFDRIQFEDEYPDRWELVPSNGASELGPDDREALAQLQYFVLRPTGAQPFASAPVRSKPHRTYDPARLDRDPDGDYVPMYLADLLWQRKGTWEALKEGIEKFGRTAGLFDEISIRQLGTKASDPFQVQVRKGGKGLKGPHRNLIDVGYGVSQVLPVITESLRPDAAAQHLLQQPEVHLHPSAQAALGTLFCQIAATGRQLIVETHSDHLMDRVRVEVRDGDSGLKPKDVSLLYFERNGLDVTIHSLQFDSEGNVHPAPNERGDIPEMPDSYRRFFMEETRRSLGL